MEFGLQNLRHVFTFFAETGLTDSGLIFKFVPYYILKFVPFPLIQITTQFM